MELQLAVLKWLNRVWVRFGIITLLAFFIFFPPIIYGFGFDVSNGILWLTGLVVLFYTMETQGMRLEMVRQNEMVIQPLIIATIEQKQVQGIAVEFRRFVVLRNIGRGPALSIQPSDVDCRHWAGARFVAKFETVDYIEPGKDAISGVTGKFRGEEVSSQQIDFVANFDPRSATETYDVTISYEDISGQKRESVVRMGKGGIKLVRHGKLSF